MYTWEEINIMLHQCRRCSLCQSRKQPVMGQGSHTARIMLVAEAPGAQEDQQGITFVGPAGRILDVLLA